MEGFANSARTEGKKGRAPLFHLPPPNPRVRASVFCEADTTTNWGEGFLDQGTTFFALRLWPNKASNPHSSLPHPFASLSHILRTLSFARSFLGCVSVFAYCPVYAHTAQRRERERKKEKESESYCRCVCFVSERERKRTKVELFWFAFSLFGCFSTSFFLFSLSTLSFIYLNRF